MKTSKNVWERQDDETSIAYAAFLRFRDLGPGRSVLAAYNQNSHRARRAPGQWNKWASQHRWKQRAAAWDNHLAIVEQKAREKALSEYESQWARRREAAREKGWTVGEALLAKAEQMLSLPIFTKTVEDIIEERELPDGKKYVVAIKRTTINPTRWTFADAARMCDTALNLMRLSAGLSTDHFSADVLSVDGVSQEAVASEERDARLLELLERARARREAALLESGRLDTGKDSDSKESEL